MKIIGLTGSIGMGKSATSKMFEAENIPVFDSDQAVHQLLGPSGLAVEIVEEAFPGVRARDYIDRKKLGSMVFNDQEALEKLEAILHPMVTKMRAAFLVDQKKSDIVLFDIPLLFEKGYENNCDYIVVVSADFEAQKKRVLERPGMSEKRFLEIVEKQMPDAEKRKKADFIIQTDQGFDYAKDQVRNILKKIRKI